MQGTDMWRGGGGTNKKKRSKVTIIFSKLSFSETNNRKMDMLLINSSAGAESVISLTQGNTYSE